jgi:hypothetical protein
MRDFESEEIKTVWVMFVSASCGCGNKLDPPQRGLPDAEELPLTKIPIFAPPFSTQQSAGNSADLLLSRG